MEDIKNKAWTEICWYFPESREQYRLGGELSLIGPDHPDDARLEVCTSALSSFYLSQITKQWIRVAQSALQLLWSIVRVQLLAYLSSGLSWEDKLSHTSPCCQELCNQQSQGFADCTGLLVRPHLQLPPSWQLHYYINQQHQHVLCFHAWLSLSTL